MTAVATATTILTPVTCAQCGVIFGLNSTHEVKLRQSHDGFYCPNGHSLLFGGKTEAERERDRLAAQLKQTENVLLSTRQSLEHMGARARTAEKSVSVRKGVITRMKRRIAAGRCVCCQHEFKDLERHMKKRHPRFDPEKHVAAMEAK